MQLDTSNSAFLFALDLIEQTKESVFLTGRAGTGKSTFLKYICKHTKKKFIVLAPTGIAALNVGGMTIHSFFGLPLRPILPNDKHIPYFNSDETKHKRKIIEEVELVIIDEISMVRADLLDGIDQALRKNAKSKDKRRPFAGKQVLMIGDVFQLPPVVTKEQQHIIEHLYDSPYFFKSNIYNQLKAIPVGLKKVYRQKDAHFLSLLDKIRVKRISYPELQELNKRYTPNFNPPIDSYVITLCATNASASTLNNQRLTDLTTPSFTFKGKIENDFTKGRTGKGLPAPEYLELKEGAQVVFVRNDFRKRWVNGTIGRVSELTNEEIKIKLDDGKTVAIETIEWENKEYQWDAEKGVIETKVIGSYTQFPLKLAWAITIHKSQGLTFQQVAIDLGRGAFATGQTYVALSRCTSIQGVFLKTMIRMRDIQVNQSVIKFARDCKGAIEKAKILEDKLAQSRTISSESEKGNWVSDSYDLNGVKK